MENLFGYCVARSKSQVGGTGVFVRCTDSNSRKLPCVQRGQIVGLYPGLLYLPQQPILLQSLGNKFIFRCIDGLHIDGNDRRLSKLIYRYTNLIKRRFCEGGRGSQVGNKCFGKTQALSAI